MDQPPTTHPSVIIPHNVTVEDVLKDGRLEMVMHDLLVLTSFKDSSTLRWRPKWFAQAPFAGRYWTLHNPPNAVTEALAKEGVKNIFTRRERSVSDGEPPFIKNWEQWKRYCSLYGIPEDFLCDRQLGLLRLGLQVGESMVLRRLGETSSERNIFPVPLWLYARDRYPEPRPESIYLLDPDMKQLLPSKFHQVNSDAVIVVHPSGKIAVQPKHLFTPDSIQSSRCNGYGAVVDDSGRVLQHDGAVMKLSGKEIKWCYMPWTLEMEWCSRSWVSVHWDPAAII